MISLSRFGLIAAALTFLSLEFALADSGVETLPGEVIVKFNQQISPEQTGAQWTTGIAAVDAVVSPFSIQSLARALPAVEDANPFGLDRIWSLKFQTNVDVGPIIEALKEAPQVEYAEPRNLRRPDRRNAGGPQSFDGLDEVPNDPSYSIQWALPKIQAAQAWDYTHGSSDVAVAIVDLGTQLDHPDLDANIWENTAELTGVIGGDDDGNGWVDDFYGWDFMDSDGYPDPSPGDSHGTHTAGSASAVTNNGVGIAGVGWSCKIMAVRAGQGSLIYYGIEGINYASLTGAQVISCSWGGPGNSQYEQDVINDATARGSLVVAAAGNEYSSAPHYPAAYDNVLAIAATNQVDQKSSYSNYGTWVDCCAPGDAIYSTVPGGYGAMSGTSMSCPHAAGLAGLVFALHDTWTPAQVSSQILSTSDNIDALNPLYAGLLGEGRINAYRAVTENNPFVVVTDQGYQDGDGDGVIEPGESVDFWVELTNLLNAVNGVQAVISSADPYVTLTQTEASFGDLGTGVSASNQATPFSFTVSPSAPGSHQINIGLLITGSGGYSTREYVFFTIMPIYGDHDCGSVVLTVTNFGSLGFQDYVGGLTLGSGFQYPAGTASALYLGSVLVGVSSSQVSDNCYGNDTYNRYDFRNVQGGELVIQPGSIADQEGFTIYNDNPSVPPVGVEVTQQSYSWADTPYDDFVVLRYDVVNTNATALNDLYVGVYLDWDVGAYSQNTAGWDADSAVGWMKNATSPYYGLCLLSHPAASYRAVQNDTYIYNPAIFSDAVKYQFMTEGFIVTQSSGPNDWSVMLSAGPFTVESGQNQTVAFAMLGGDDPSDLQQNVGSARLQWNNINVSAPPVQDPSMPAAFALQKAYPNPFNPQTTIRFSLPAPAPVRLEIYDLSGKLVATLLNGWQPAGNHQAQFVAAENLASGIYLAKLTAGSAVGIEKLILLK